MFSEKVIIITIDKMVEDVLQTNDPINDGADLLFKFTRNTQFIIKNARNKKNLQ